MKNVLKCLCIYDAEYIRQAYYAAATFYIQSNAEIVYQPPSVAS